MSFRDRVSTEIDINPSTEENQELALARYDLILDNTTTTDVIYIWEALIWSLTSSASWRIKKLNEASWLTIGWAGSDFHFDNIWDNRDSLTYSQ